jgi:hypothetical protein
LFAEDRIVTRSTLTKITNKSNKVKTEIRNDTKKNFVNDNNKNLIQLSLLENERPPFSRYTVLDSATEINNYNFNISMSEEITEKFEMSDEKTTITFRVSNQNKRLVGLWEKLRFKKEKNKCYPVICLICDHVDYHGNIRRHLKKHKIECKCRKRTRSCTCEFDKQQSSIITGESKRFEHMIKNDININNLESTEIKDKDNLS